MKAPAYFWRMMVKNGPYFSSLFALVSNGAHWLDRHEHRLFYAALGMLLLPVWATEGWYTFDGPAHLYNAEVLGELLWGKEHPLLDYFYQIRWPPSPNLLFYVFAAPLSRVLDIGWVDKLWATLHILVFGIGFRFFLLTISGKRCKLPLAAGRGLAAGHGLEAGRGLEAGHGLEAGRGLEAGHGLEAGRGLEANQLAAWASWVGLYGAFHQHFFLGQYNFAMAIGLLWWTLGYAWRWISVQQPMNWSLLRLGGLLTLLGMSHLVGFASAGISLGMMLIWLKGRQPRQFLTRILSLLVASFPSLLINIYYLWHSSGTGITRYIGRFDLIYQWIRLEALTSFNPPVEWRAMSGLFLLGVLVFPMAVLAYAQVQRKSNGSQHRLGDAWAYLLLCAGIFMLMYLIMPDESRHSGYLSSRLALIGQLYYLAGGALLLGVAPSSIRRFSLVLLVILLPFRVAYYWRVERSLGRDLSEMRATTAQIPTDRIVHQLNLSTNWMHEHMSMSVSGRGIIHLKNYEAYLDYFPLGWRSESIQPWMTHARFWSHWPPCPDSAVLAQLSVALKPDYLIVWDDRSLKETTELGCRNLLDAWLFTNYHKLHASESERCSVWIRKQ